MILELYLKNDGKNWPNKIITDLRQWLNRMEPSKTIELWKYELFDMYKIINNHNWNRENYCHVSSFFNGSGSAFFNDLWNETCLKEDNWKNLYESLPNDLMSDVNGFSFVYFFFVNDKLDFPDDDAVSIW